MEGREKETDTRKGTPRLSLTLDDDTPEGRLNKHIRATIAEFEREKIAQRMTRGRRNAVKKGKVMLHGDKPPYGYRLEDGALVIYEPEARIVRMIYTWYVVDGLSLRAIAGRLTEMGVPTWADTHSNGFKKKRGRGEWIVASVDKILRKELYAGSWFYGKTNSKSGRNPREHWLSVEVPAILSREVWEKAQERRAHNREMSTRNTQHDYLVGRRVWCQCGAKMGSRLAGGRPYYYCRRAAGRLVEKNCDAKLFRADHVDAAVWVWVKSWLSDPEALRHGLEKQQAEQERANKPLFNRLAVIDDLLSDRRRQLEKLLDLYLSGDFDKTMLTDRKTRLETTITALEKERDDLVTTLESQTLTDEQIATIEDFAKKVSAGLEIADQDFEARRQIIDLLDVRVTLAIEDGEKIAYVRCLLDEASLSIESTSSRCCRGCPKG